MPTLPKFIFPRDAANSAEVNGREEKGVHLYRAEIMSRTLNHAREQFSVSCIGPRPILRRMTSLSTPAASVPTHHGSPARDSRTLHIACESGNPRSLEAFMYGRTRRLCGLGVYGERVRRLPRNSGSPATKVTWIALNPGVDLSRPDLNT